jgi:hypothetical protein
MMLAADAPAVVATAPVEKPPDVVVIRRDSHSEVIVSRDTPLPLIKAHRTEDAVLRQAIFLTSTLTVVRPSSGPGGDTLRWAYEPYLQRQLCFTSITGLFSCAAAEVEELTEKATGEAPVANPAAEGARMAVAAALRTRATALFADDRRLKLRPMLKAAGVSIRRASAGSARR